MDSRKSDEVKKISSKFSNLSSNELDLKLKKLTDDLTRLNEKIKRTETETKKFKNERRDDKVYEKNDELSRFYTLKKTLSDTYLAISELTGKKVDVNPQTVSIKETSTKLIKKSMEESFSEMPSLRGALFGKEMKLTKAQEKVLFATEQDLAQTVAIKLLRFSLDDILLKIKNQNNLLLNFIHIVKSHHTSFGMASGLKSLHEKEQFLLFLDTIPACQPNQPGSWSPKSTLQQALGPVTLDIPFELELEDRQFSSGTSHIPSDDRIVIITGFHLKSAEEKVKSVKQDLELSEFIKSIESFKINSENKKDATYLEILIKKHEQAKIKANEHYKKFKELRAVKRDNAAEFEQLSSMLYKNYALDLYQEIINLINLIDQSETSHQLYMPKLNVQITQRLEKISKEDLLIKLNTEKSLIDKLKIIAEQSQSQDDILDALSLTPNEDLLLEYLSKLLPDDAIGDQALSKQISKSVLQGTGIFKDKITPSTTASIAPNKRDQKLVLN